MVMIIGLLALALIGIAGITIKFILGEENEQKKKQKKNSELVENLEAKVKTVQEELVRENAEKKEIEDLLYKTKDELDSLKSLNNELSQEVKDSGKIKENLDKKDETIKQEVSEKEKIRAELKKAMEEAAQAMKEKEELQKESGSGKDVAESLKKENEELENKIKSLEEIHQGLKGQYDELGKQLETINKIRIEESLSKEGTKPESVEASPDKTEKPAGVEMLDKGTPPYSLSAKTEQSKPIEPDIKAETGKQPDGKPKTTSDYLKEKAKETAGENKEETKPEEKSDKKQDNQEDKKETAADVQLEKEKSPEQEQQKPPSGSPENKP